MKNDLRNVKMDKGVEQNSLNQLQQTIQVIKMTRIVAKKTMGWIVKHDIKCNCKLDRMFEKNKFIVKRNDPK